jgi:hypothetical protein
MRKTNYAFQRALINKGLQSRGINPDTVDTHARIDRKLSLRENFREIVGKQKRMPETTSMQKTENYLEAVDKFSQFNSKRQFIDSRINAKKTYEQSELSNKNYNKWKKYPNRYDIAGVDTKY